ncbi:MAG: cyclic nucleotide-binding domain-containing protein [Desulfobacterales bacterium]
MDLTGYRIRITNAANCPAFKADEILNFSAHSLVLPMETHLCLGFVENLSSVLPETANVSALAFEFNCSGDSIGKSCGLTYLIEKSDIETKIFAGAMPGKNIEAISRLLLNLPMFRSFDKYSITRFLSYFQVEHIYDLGFKSYRIGDIFIKKGEPGRNLYIIIAGRAEVIDEEGNSIAFLANGEVFGEMSLISGNPISATVRAAAPTTVIRLSSRDFTRILPKFPALQTYFARLLTQRLSQSNTERARDLSAVMAGDLSEMPPEDVMQTMHINQKTGVLNFWMGGVNARVFFNQGEIIQAEYGRETGRHVIAKICQNRAGKFNFSPKLPPEAEKMEALGSFMAILISALKDIDDHQNRISTQ